MALRATLRHALLGLSLLGLLAFGSVLLMTFVAPLAIEQAGREALRIEVQRRVGGKVDALSDTHLADMARRAMGRSLEDSDRLQRELRDQVPQRVAAALANLLNADCECRKRLIAHAKEAHEQKLGSMREAQARMADWIEHAYAHTRDQLLREVRAVTAAHAALFVLLGLLCIWRRPSALQLAWVAVVLLGASVAVGSCYLFKQDWIHTLVFGDYLGWGYAAYLTGVTALFADIGFNRGRITSQLGGFFHLPAC